MRRHKQRYKHRHKPNHGFTLVEILVTLMILTISSVVILQQLQVLLKNQQVRKDLTARNTQLLNQAEVFLMLDPSGVSARNAVIVADQLQWRLPKIAQNALKEMPMQLNINNFSIPESNISVSLGYSPYQLYRLESGRFQVNLVTRGLLPGGS